MANRIPLTIVAGQVEQIQSGDLVDSAFLPTSSTPDVVQQKQAPTANTTIAAGYSAYVSNSFEAGNGLILEVANTGTFEIG